MSLLLTELADALERLYESNDVGEQHGFAYYFTSDIKKDAETLACKCLIDNEGHCEWDNISWLENHGYSVFAGERDSFGWLTGCIQKKGDKRILVYG